MITQTALNTYVKETGGRAASLLEACTRCGMCAEACHFYQGTGNPEYAPVWKIELLRRAYEQRFTLVGKAKLALGIEKAISDADLEHWSEIVYYACTLCNKCSMVCPASIPSWMVQLKDFILNAFCNFLMASTLNSIISHLNEGSISMKLEKCFFGIIKECPGKIGA